MEDLRDILIKKILKYSKEKSKTFFLDCDVGKHTRLENHEVNYMNLGICEQNAVSIAAGLSTNKDNIVIVSSFAEFIMGRCWEQIKHSVVYNKSNATIIGTHSGFSCSEDGASHQCFEDIALALLIPEIEVYSPGFEIECEQIAKHISEKSKTPMYIRLCHGNIQYDTKNMKIFPDYIKRNGKDNTKKLILSTGYITQEVLKAIEELEKLGLSVDLIHIGRFRTINETNIVEELKEYKKIIIVEEHALIGGLNNFINNLCIKYRLNIDIINIYVRDGFGQSGNLDDLRKKAKIDYSTIINIVKKLENKKSDK